MVNDIAVQDFVNAIKETPTDTTTTYNATVSRIDNEGVVWVNLYGSDKETPTASTSTEVKSGDNVTVNWRNNKLYIGGNYSNPSAGIATVQPSVNFVNQLASKNVTAESITASTGYIGELTANNITAESISADHAMIQELDVESMSAAVAYISDLTAENITAEDIAADHATVGSLDTNYAHITSGVIDNATIGYADVNGLSANYASIGALNAATGRIDTLEANEATINDTLTATNAHVEYLESDWISTDRLVLTGNNKNNYPPVEITQSEFNANKTAYYTKSGSTYTQCTSSSVYDADTQYYVKQTVQSIIEAINTANNTDPQIVVSNDKLIAASMDVAELSAITADMGTLTAGKIQKGNNFINLDTSPASMEFKNASTWANATQGIKWDTQGNLSIKGEINVTSGNAAKTSDIPTDVSDLTDSTGVIPTDVSDLSDSTGVIPTDVSDLTDTTHVIPDVSGKADKTDAVYRSQRIYYRKTSSGAPSKNTTWLSTSGTGYGNWSLKIPQLTSGTTKYPYLYTAVQTQTVSQSSGTTCSCSDVLLDDTTTVIDGGTIITGTVNANAVNASSGTFDTANIPNLSATKITSDTLSADRIAGGSLAIGKLDTNAQNTISDAAKTATNYLTTITGTSGISVHDANDTNNYVNISSSGVDVYKGGSSVAFFGETARVGKSSGASHVDIDYHSLQLINKEGNPYFYISDLRDSSGIAALTITRTGDGETTVFRFSPWARLLSYDVTVSDNSGGTITKDVNKVTFSTPPTYGSTITISYETTDETALAFTIGTRAANTSIGGASIAAGIGVEASGDYSHAEGFYSVASGSEAHAEGASSYAAGMCSHAEGGASYATGDYSHSEGDFSQALARASHAQNETTVANKRAQTTIGTFNKVDNATTTTHPSEDANYGKYAFIVGNGTGNSASQRSNALTVDWAGNVEASGNITDGNGNTVSKGYCYVNSITAVTITATNSWVQIPMTAMGSGSGFSYDSTNKGITCTKAGVYAISAQVPLDTATSGDLIGLCVYKNGTLTIGPVYTRVGGNYDGAILMPTIFNLANNDLIRFYIRNNTGARGVTGTGVRIMLWEVF